MGRWGNLLTACNEGSEVVVAQVDQFNQWLLLQSLDGYGTQLHKQSYVGSHPDKLHSCSLTLSH